MGILSFAAGCAAHRTAAPEEAIPAVAPVRVLPINSPAAPDPEQPAAAPRAPSDAPAATAPPPAKPPDAAAIPNPLAEQGKERFRAYKCYECHGANGEGTNDGPDLIGTHLDAEQIAAFLQKPSPDARSAGMPTIPAASPDLQPLVAYVLSLKRSAAPR